MLLVHLGLHADDATLVAEQVESINYHRATTLVEYFQMLLRSMQQANMCLAPSSSLHVYPVPDLEGNDCNMRLEFVLANRQVAR